jgi:hypothetical protein
MAASGYELTSSNQIKSILSLYRLALSLKPLCPEMLLPHAPVNAKLAR